MDRTRKNAAKFLFESEGIIIPRMVSHIRDVDISKENDYIRIDFTTIDDVKRSLVAKYSRFKDWYVKNADKNSGNVFLEFLKAFIKNSKQDTSSTESDEEVNEIVDGDGNLYDDSSMPNNSRGNLVGTSTPWDMDHVYNSLIPKNSKPYYGTLGYGVITW